MCSIPIFSRSVLTSRISHESFLPFNISKSFDKLTRSTLIYEAKLTLQHALCIVIQSECRKVTSERQTRPYFFTIHESFFLSNIEQFQRNILLATWLIADRPIFVADNTVFSACHLKFKYKQRIMGCISKYRNVCLPDVKRSKSF